MLDSLLKKAFILYLCLTIIEYGLVFAGGSLLKYYGYIIIAIWILNPKRKIPNLLKNKELLYFGIYLVIVSISLLWSDDTEMGSYYFVSMANMLVLITIASTLSWNNTDVKIMLFLFQVSATLFSLLLISRGELYHGVFRPTLTIFGEEQDPNNLSAMLIIPTIISFWYILNKKHVLLNLIFFVSNAFAVIYLSSRGGLISVIAGCIFLLLFNGKYLENRINTSFKLYLTLTLVVLGIFLYLLIIQIDENLLIRYTMENIEQDKGSDRLIIWALAIRLFDSAPLLGVGIGSFQGITQLGVHNQFLIVLVESGIVGFLFFVVSILTLFRKALRSKVSLLPAIVIGTVLVIFFLDAYNKKFFWNAYLISAIFFSLERRNKLETNLQPEA